MMRRSLPGDAVVGVEATIASYFSSFAPGVSWEDLCAWPPDVFALANLVLDQTESYRFAVAPPADQRWPPTVGWNESVLAAAREWRDTAGSCPGRAPPRAVQRDWEVVSTHLDAPLSALRRGAAIEVIHALLTLHAIADQACERVGASPAREEGESLEHTAWCLLEQHGSMSRVSPTRIHVTPKTHFATRGITIRSFSRYLALNYEAIDVGWQRIRPARWGGSDRRELNLVLLPWPLRLESTAFSPRVGPLDNMHEEFGFFDFDPGAPVDLDLLRHLVLEATQKVDRVHAVLLPEDAIAAEELADMEEVITDLGVGCLFTGVRARPMGGHMGRNLAHFGVRTSDGWVHYEQAKHHRWCLDEAQIRQYRLSRVLRPSRLWWEAIDLPARTVQIIDVGNGTTVAPLICEDLARLDEVADVLRRVGPSLVVALLLDGPQLAHRWPARYASVLADEPGSAVLTLTSFGMVTRSRPPGARRSRAIAMWSGPGAGRRPIELGHGAKGVVITLSAQPTSVWTADGRRHDGTTPALTLRSVEQLHGRTGPRASADTTKLSDDSRHSIRRPDMARAITRR